MKERAWLGEFLLDGFESQVATAHGEIISHALSTFPNPLNLVNSQQRMQFVQLVHEGYALAQDIIVDLLLTIGAEREDCLKRLKSAKDEHDEKSARHFYRQSRSLVDQEHIIPKLADSIAWSILSHHWVVRRYYIGVPIDRTSLLAAKRGADWLAKQNHGSFALLTDTTSFVQIGDFLFVDGMGECRSVELKSGRVNEEVRAFLESLRIDTFAEQIARYAQEKGPVHFRQVMRVMKQDVRYQSAAQILEEGSGKDLVTGLNVWIQESDIQLNYFTNRVADLLKQTAVTDSAVNLVDGCLHVGVFDARLHLDSVFVTWVRSLGCGSPFVDFRGTFREPLAVPPFIIAVRDKDVMDITMGRKCVLLCLDLDKWIALGRRMGINVQWATRKETGRALDKSHRGSRPYVHGHRMITVLTGNQSSKICWGLLARIFFEFLTPSSALELVSIPLKVPKDDDTSSGKDRR